MKKYEDKESIKKNAKDRWKNILEEHDNPKPIDPTTRENTKALDVLIVKYKDLKELAAKNLELFRSTKEEDEYFAVWNVYSLILFDLEDMRMSSWNMRLVPCKTSRVYAKTVPQDQVPVSNDIAKNDPPEQASE